MNDYQLTVLQPVCPDCGADLHPLAEQVAPQPLDWRDERERELGHNALVVQTHRHEAHPVVPKVGDVVAYFAPWRGMILGNGPLVVRVVREHDIHDYARSMGHTDLPVLMCTKYSLENPSRSGDYWLPSTGDPARPITFEILDEYIAPPVETTLFDLLGGEWAAVA
ncbi:hypothetical protein [Microbacterium resistens]